MTDPPIPPAASGDQVPCASDELDMMYAVRSTARRNEAADITIPCVVCRVSKLWRFGRTSPQNKCPTSGRKLRSGTRAFDIMG